VSRIVFAWELGSSLGHVSLLLPFAQKLSQQGHDVILVLRELQNVQNLPVGNLHVLQAPLWIYPPTGLSEPPLNYSEILMRYGYLDAEGLGGLVSAWRSLFSLHASDAIVADHSPTALLAARSMGLPATTLGSGFYYPPRQTPMLNMRPWLNVPPERLEHSDMAVLKSMNTVLASYQAQPLGAVNELFENSENFLCTFAELDHYSQREPTQYWGACYNLEMGQNIDWPEGGEKRVFAYLDPQNRDFSKVLDAIRGLGLRAIVCAPGIPDNLRDQFATSRIILSGKPFRLKELMRDCDLVIGNAGHALTAGMLMAGVPLLLLPTHLERFLLATRIASLGAGIAVNPEAPPPDFMSIIHSLLTIPEYREKASHFARKYANFSQEEQQDTIVARIEKIAAAKQVHA